MSNDHDCVDALLQFILSEVPRCYVSYRTLFIVSEALMTTKTAIQAFSVKVFDKIA